MSEPAAAGSRRTVPSSTYRLQIRPEFGFQAAAGVVEHLDALGASHAYLSPVLQPAPGSAHGYDVVDHSRLNREAGGRAAFDRLVSELHARQMGAVADVVPNHMAVPTPASLNAALWSVLRDGPTSPFARWFDVDWTVEDRAVLMPVLGQRIGQVLDAGELALDRVQGPQGRETVLRYYEHVFPVRPGTERLPLATLVDRQWYRLAHWRVADEELNYRRFFDVDTLAAVRVEDPEVFDATHQLLLELVAAGQLDGLRIDHPDGLADPRGYLRRLAERTAEVSPTGQPAWVVVEKILEGEEVLPADWPCAGTTGYEALMRVGGLFVDPAGAAPLSSLLTELTGDTPDFSTVVDEAKREVVEHGLYAEVHRLVDLLWDVCHDDVMKRDHTRRALHECVVELLVGMEVYRGYVVPGEPAPEQAVHVVHEAAERARAHLPVERHDTLELVRDLVLGRNGTGEQQGSIGPRDRRVDELVVRFQQTCGPVMAKGVEDTAFYRWFRLTGLNEVGGDPARFGVAPEEFHAYCASQQRTWPTSMTTLSTHDTKRSEDVRARLLTLAERYVDWADAVRGWREVASHHRSPEGWPDPSTEYLLWQTLVGTWSSGPGGTGPLSAERLTAYLEKATREAKRHTSWTSQDATFESGVRDFAVAVLADADLMASVGTFVAGTDAAWRVAVLGQKLVQLTMPGVPDVYQGTECVDLSLVDPDNRRPVDFAGRRERLARLDDGTAASDLDSEKLLVVSRALRLRRQHPDWFVGQSSTYAPVATTSGNAVAFARGDGDGPQAVTVATRLPVALERHGGWGGHTLGLPEGRWRDVLTGRETGGGAVPLGEVLAELPVALLVRAG